MSMYKHNSIITSNLLYVNMSCRFSCHCEAQLLSPCNSFRTKAINHFYFNASIVSNFSHCLLFFQHSLTNHNELYLYIMTCLRHNFLSRYDILGNQSGTLKFRFLDLLLLICIVDLVCDG